MLGYRSLDDDDDNDGDDNDDDDDDDDGEDDDDQTMLATGPMLEEDWCRAIAPHFIHSVHSRF